MKRIFSVLVAVVMLVSQTYAALPVKFNPEGFHVFRVPQDPNSPTRSYKVARNRASGGAVWSPKASDREAVALYNRVRSSVVRLHMTRTRSLGTGTVIATRPEKDGRVTAVILTCAHIFECGDIQCAESQKPVAEFKGMRSSAKVLALDWENDLCALAVYAPKGTVPMEINTKIIDPDKEPNIGVAGFGGTRNIYRAHFGALQGYTSAGYKADSPGKFVPGHPSHQFVTSGNNQLLVASGHLRRGDSGGPMFDTNGKLVGVFWGGDSSGSIGTYAGTITTFLGTKVSETYAWCCPPSSPSCQPCYPSQPCYPYYPQPRAQPRRPVSPQPPRSRPQSPPPQVFPHPTEDLGGEQPVVVPPSEPVTEPVPDSVPDTPPSGNPPSGNPDTPTGPPANNPTPAPGLLDPINVLIENQHSLRRDHEQLIKLIQGLADKQDELSGKLSAPSGEHESLLQGIQGLQENQVKILELVRELRDNPSEAAVTLKVESGRYISPAYVDVSVLWALQQSTGVDHMVLVTDTSADHWNRMKGEYEAAKAKYPAIVLYDVKGKGLRFKELPQIVVYPVGGTGEPEIVKGTDGVSKILQKIVRDEF